MADLWLDIFNQPAKILTWTGPKSTDVAGKI
jgi:hypothetical protein